MTDETSAPTEQLYGRDAELHNAGFVPAKNPEPEREEIGGDVASLREAGKQLAERSAKSETIEVKYIDAPANMALTIDQAAADYSKYKGDQADAAEQAETDRIAANVDLERYAALSENANNAHTYGIDLPELEQNLIDRYSDEKPAKADEADKTDGARETQSAPDADSDAELEKALRHPAIWDEIDKRVSAADNTKRAYEADLAAVKDIATMTIFDHFPELAGLTQEQAQWVMEEGNRRQPGRYNSLGRMVERVTNLQQMQQVEQGKKAAANAEAFRAYTQEQDAKFNKSVGDIPEAQKPKILSEILLAAQEHGVGEHEFKRLFNSEPIMRHAAFQRMMLDAAQYRLMKKAPPPIRAPAPVPHTQKPGVSRPAEPHGSENVRSMEAKFSKNPSVKNAMALREAKNRMSGR